MFHIDMGAPRNLCNGVTRRSFLQLGVAGMAAASLSDVLKAQAASAALGQTKKDTSVILIWLDGGPSQMDMYDLKPDAPAEYRGPFSPIKTKIPGMEISETMPLQAKVADSFSIIRSLSHGTADHIAGSHLMLTGRMGPVDPDRMPRNPSVGSIASKLCGSRKAGVPAYVGMPYTGNYGIRPGYFGASYLGQSHNPFDVDNDPGSASFKVQNLDIASGMTLCDPEDRQGLRQKFDKMRHEVDSQGRFKALDDFQQQAFDLVSSSATRKAFDIASEAAPVRDAYGRNSWGQSLLLARRLVEAGVTFVSCIVGGWDHHWDIKPSLEHLMEMLDKALAMLFTDLKQRGLYDKTLVVMCGEFGRTPKMNDGGNGGAPMSMGAPGRDHWCNSMFCLLGGGGVHGGRVVGSTTRLGDAPADRPVSPGDIHATIYRTLGIDPKVQFLDFAGRPLAAVESGRVIEELV